jgi:glucose-6-phosphate-specific signal transduction histidine kinase
MTGSRSDGGHGNACYGVEEISDGVEAGLVGLGVAVSDDGRGGADIGAGSGLVGLKDRVESLGGRLAVQTAPDAGTTVHVELPLSRPSTVQI